MKPSIRQAFMFAVICVGSAGIVMMVNERMFS